MNEAEKLVRCLLAEQQHPSAAVRRIKKMIASGVAGFESEPPPPAVEDLHSLWSVRLWASVIKGRQILGLRDFVRRLGELPTSARLRQIAVTQGSKTGILFVDGQSQSLIGAVFSAPTAADLHRSEENLAFANSVEAPQFLVRSAAR